MVFKVRTLAYFVNTKNIFNILHYTGQNSKGQFFRGLFFGIGMIVSVAVKKDIQGLASSQASSSKIPEYLSGNISQALRIALIQPFFLQSVSVCS